MTRRSLRLVLVLVAFALALIAAGCGSKSSSSGLGTALDYVPKGAPLVVAFDTDPDGSQFKQLDKLIGKFPFGGQVKQGFKTGFKNSSRLDFDTQIKPLLGNELVVAVPTAEALQGGGRSGFVAAWKVKDAAAGKKLVQANSTKVGSSDGADIYRSNAGTSFTAIKDGTLVAAATQPDIEAALKRAGGSDHMTEGDFNGALGDLNKDALVRVTGDFQALLSGPQAAAARKVKWLGALRSFGATVSADPDGIGSGLRIKTEGSLGAQDLPLASGSQSAPVVRRAGEIGIGIRNPAQIMTFAQAVSQVTDPAGYAKYVKQKAKVGKQLGVNVDRDLIGQLSGNSAVSVSLSGDFAVRADLRDPAAAEATLKKIAPRLQKLAKGKSVGLSTPKGGKGFYALAQANGKKLVFGVVGKTFVAATDAGRAAQFAGQSPSVVTGVKGALVVASDARALANALAAKRGQSGAQIVTGALGDLTGSVQSETSGLSADFKLQIK
jgi:hypothetical protein